MNKKTPEALAVLDRFIDYIDPDGHTYHFNEVEQVRKLRAAFAELYEAGQFMPTSEPWDECTCESCNAIVRFSKALAAVEELP